MERSAFLIKSNQTSSYLVVCFQIFQEFQSRANGRCCLSWSSNKRHDVTLVTLQIVSTLHHLSPPRPLPPHKSASRCCCRHQHTCRARPRLDRGSLSLLLACAADTEMDE